MGKGMTGSDAGHSGYSGGRIRAGEAKHQEMSMEATAMVLVANDEIMK